MRRLTLPRKGHGVNRSATDERASTTTRPAAGTTSPCRHGHRTRHTAPPDPPTTATDLAGEALEFLREFAADHRTSDRHLTPRIHEVQAEIDRTGTYRHTTAELRFGCRLAWRNSIRCIGRARWRNLVVRDRRDVSTAAGIAAELAGHLSAGTNGGRIRPVVTVFAPDRPGVGPRARIWNDQLIRYAGHPGDGAPIGDPAQADLTRRLADLGWQPPTPPGRFDILPWAIETEHERPQLFPVPRQLVREVSLSHPRYPWLAQLGLRWHVLPVVSNMRLRIGGVDYSCAPFSGWYVGDEIATRNFGDTGRYDLLPTIAAHLGLDTEDRAVLWREQAALVLNQAVLHSFIAAGVTISDAYGESLMFRRFVDREEAAGRPVPADWPWINGHFGHSLGPAFHRNYSPDEPATNYWPDPDRLSTPPLAAQPLAAQPGCPR